MFPDMTKEAFIATLRVRWKGKNVSFSSAKVAEKFFNEGNQEENEEEIPNTTD